MCNLRQQLIATLTASFALWSCQRSHTQSMDGATEAIVGGPLETAGTVTCAGEPCPVSTTWGDYSFCVGCAPNSDTAPRVFCAHAANMPDFWTTGAECGQDHHLAEAVTAHFCDGPEDCGTGLCFATLAGGGASALRLVRTSCQRTNPPGYPAFDSPNRIVCHDDTDCTASHPDGRCGPTQTVPFELLPWLGLTQVAFCESSSLAPRSFGDQ